MASRSEPAGLPGPGGCDQLPGPTRFGLRADEPFPRGVHVDIAEGVQRLSPQFLLGGSPARMVRLTPRGADLLAALASGPVNDNATARLARKLTDAGVAVPRPAHPCAPVDVTVVVPVRDRPGKLDTCLRALGKTHRVVVVDDGSTEPDAVAAICRAHGAEIVRRQVSGGAAAARNAGLRMVSTELVAFVDSDAVPGAGWIEALAAHFVDPLVVGVAPRIVAASSGSGQSLLDLGPRPAAVHARSGVSYVPTAAVLFRRPPLGDGFDERLRFGEDVDLVWRLNEAGWRIRYEPSVEVAHQDPVSALQRLQRRFLYGTSVGPLERRHRAAIDHLSIDLGPACTLGSVLVGSPGLAAIAWAVTTVHLGRRLRPLGLGTGFACRLSATQLHHAWIGLGRWCTTFAVPLGIGSLLVGRTRAARRVVATLALLIFSAAMAEQLGPGGRDRRVLLDGCVGEAVYGVGVVAGCMRARVFRPLIPRIGIRRRG